ncbi:hypothetical protein RJT34_08104 [Clitoria ternatea]|uniref:Beta-galactosidase n=1 Tax=Clitoria ternatea TaxID=43366 RepID=A0AAN9K598_CLITE
MGRTTIAIVVLTTLLSIITGTHAQRKHGRQIKAQNVTYDGRSLFINGRREILFSGSIHYPRSTPDKWSEILDYARHGGLNVIQTYVFWNVHEPQPGQFNFEGNYDLVKFIKLVQSKGMFVTLRIGPFIQAEWNHGGLPYWLREIPGIIFRTDNEPYKKYMEAFVTKIVQMMKDEKLFAPQGGPIILAQIENEYSSVQRVFLEKGASYVRWAADMAVALHTGVPWIMCKQELAPESVISACNGRQCGDTFSGLNKPHKPALWTENWTTQYSSFGDDEPHRSTEDIAYSVARFMSKNGNLANYYMYHGGTNFGRTSAAFTTTRYYDDSPLDEYGLPREPKWSHLKDLHKALLLCRKALLNGNSKVQQLNPTHEIRVFENPKAKICAAFISNNSTQPAIINFRGTNYNLPAHSISILPDCKTVVFNTYQIVAEHNTRSFVRSAVANNHQWEVYSEAIPTIKKLPVVNTKPLELYTFLKDTTDYAWYTTSFELTPEDFSRSGNAGPMLFIDSLGHSLLAFINGDYIGSGHGSHDKHSFNVTQHVNLRVGTNYISILAGLVGLPDSGVYMERRYAGPKIIKIYGLNTGILDLSANTWTHKAGIKGEDFKVFTEDGSKKVKWTPLMSATPRALSWYKTRFATPEGTGPIAIRMTGMEKGMIYVNGKSIGRHWMLYNKPGIPPTQSDYHIPRAYLNPQPQDNLLVILEEEMVTPGKVEIVNIDRDTICSAVNEDYPTSVNSWVSRKGEFLPAQKNMGIQSSLTCPPNKKITSVQFASFGNPKGFCGGFVMGNCNVASTQHIVEKECLGKKACSVPLNRINKSGNPCPGVVKRLAIQVRCS